MSRFFIFIFISPILICCSNLVSAQIEKGNYILGGTAGINNVTNTNGNSLTTLILNPMYGTFITDYFLIGGNVNLDYRFSGKNKSMTIKAGPLLRYYFKNIFLQTDYNFGIPFRNYFEQDIYLRLGYAYFLNENVAIEPYVFIGYQDLMYRKGSRSFGYFDKGIYFSIQVYLESSLNKAMKMHKGILKRKQ